MRVLRLKDKAEVPGLKTTDSKMLRRGEALGSRDYSVVRTEGILTLFPSLYLSA